MRLRRAARAFLTLFLFILTCVGGGTGARAQAPSEITLTLVSQTSFTTPEEPRLEITVRATNTGEDTIDDLTVGFTIGAPIRSRDQYESSLINGPGAFPPYATTFAKQDSLGPGQERLFTVRADLSDPATVGAAVSPDDSLVYPARVDLRSRGVTAAVVDTALIHVVRPPEQPLLLSWWAEITGPIALDPQGRLADPAFEETIGPQGSLGAEVEALRRLVTDPTRRHRFDVVIEPAVVEQLARMADGYQRSDGSSVGRGRGGAADAATLLDSLRTVTSTPDVQVVAMPFAAPLLPSMLSSGLATDLERQEAAGRRVLDTYLGLVPTTEVARPPQGAMDDSAMGTLAERGVTTVLADADTVARPPQPNSFAPPPVAVVIPTIGGNALQLVLPDPGADRLVRDPTLQADPVRVAQAVLGELATIWRESPVPVPPTVRGVALALPAGLSSGLYGPLTRRLTDASFLRGVTAPDLAAQIEPPGDAATLQFPSSTPFVRDYAEAIRQERRDVNAYRSMLVDPSAVPDRLDRNLLYAEAGQFVVDEAAGRSWIDQVNSITEAVFAQAQPEGPQAFAFTARAGTIPVRMGDPGPVPLRVEVQLRSAWFRFPQGNTQLVTLDQTNQVVNFRVEATASSQGHSIEMIVSAPTGRALGKPQTLVVRSAAVNRIALYITIAAALGLVALWSRRLVRRPSRS